TSPAATAHGNATTTNTHHMVTRAKARISNKVADGSLSMYKARLVANGRNQQQGIDFDETFSPVVKPATVRTQNSERHCALTG
ncbi:ribonuclease H-like domain-containing protein, partial [Tanacetum coccineum]